MKGIRSFFRCISKTLLLGIFGHVISLHGKRILFLASLHCQLRNCPRPSRETLEKLNAALKLASVDDGSLFFPARYHQLFWDQDKFRQKMFECGVDGTCDIVPQPVDIEKISQGILDITPTWFRYGRREDMVEDLKKLLQFQSIEVKAV
jgi:hypothetical protein